jgi:riboflavin biosynthesis pyrimidine reductase
VLRDVGPAEIDEYRIYVQPMLLGTGRLLFQSPQARTALRLAENLAFGNGVVLLRYARA